MSEEIKQSDEGNKTETPNAQAEPQVTPAPKHKARKGLNIPKNLYFVFGAVLIVGILILLFASGTINKKPKPTGVANKHKVKETKVQYFQSIAKAKESIKKAQPQKANNSVVLPPMSPETKIKIKKLQAQIKASGNNYTPVANMPKKNTLEEKAYASPMVVMPQGANNYQNSVVSSILGQQNGLQALQNKTNEALKSVPNMEQKIVEQAKIAQLEKTHPNQAFLLSMKSKEENYQKVLVSQRPVSSCEVEAGTVIPAVLMSKINSNLPGFIKAQVVNNIYSYNGQCLEIPKGTFLIGMYSSQITANQSRLLVAFKTLELPSGRQLNLLGMSGMEGNGTAGFHDLVNTHFWTMFGTSLLLSFINVGSQAYGTASGAMAPSSYGGTAPVTAAGVGESTLSNTASTLSQNMLSKYTNIPPTLIIRQGYRFNVFVSRNMVLPEDK